MVKEAAAFILLVAVLMWGASQVGELLAGSAQNTTSTIIRK